MNLQADISIIFDPYFTVLRLADDVVEVHSNNSGDDWKITRSDYGYFILSHRHPDKKDYHYQTSLGTFEDCVLELALHDEYMLRKRKYYVLPEESLSERLLRRK